MVEGGVLLEKWFQLVQWAELGAVADCRSLVERDEGAKIIVHFLKEARVLFGGGHGELKLQWAF